MIAFSDNFLSSVYKNWYELRKKKSPQVYPQDIRSMIQNDVSEIFNHKLAINNLGQIMTEIISFKCGKVFPLLCVTPEEFGLVIMLREVSLKS